MFKTSAELRLENLALRQQLGVLRRSAPKRLRLTNADRAFWVSMKRVWARWDQVLMIVKPETVLAWHRKGFRLFWTWRVSRGRRGRPNNGRVVEVRELRGLHHYRYPRRKCIASRFDKLERRGVLRFQRTKIRPIHGPRFTVPISFMNNQCRAVGLRNTTQ